MKKLIVLIFLVVQIVPNVLWSQGRSATQKHPWSLANNSVSVALAASPSGFAVESACFEWRLQGSFSKDSPDLFSGTSVFFGINNYHDLYDFYGSYYTNYEVGIGHAWWGPHWGAYGKMNFWFKTFSVEAGLMFNVGRNFKLCPYWSLVAAHLNTIEVDDANFFGCRLQYEFIGDDPIPEIRSMRASFWKLVSIEMTASFSGDGSHSRFQATYNDQAMPISLIRLRLLREIRVMSDDNYYISFDLIGSACYYLPNYNISDAQIGFAGGLGLRYGRNKWSLFAQAHAGTLFAADFGFTFSITPQMSLSPIISLAGDKNMVCRTLGIGLRYDLYSKY